MKSLIRSYTFHLLALWLTDSILGDAFQISGDLKTLLSAALVLALLNIFIKPILKLLFLPINALTLGLFSVVIGAGVFFLFLKLVPAVTIGTYHFPGITWGSFGVNAFDLNFLGTLFLASLVLGLIINFLTFLVE